MSEIPRPLSLVKCTSECNRLTNGDTYLFLGEIPNMKAHCIVVDVDTGEIHIGHHTNRFKELTEDEV